MLSAQGAASLHEPANVQGANPKNKPDQHGKAYHVHQVFFVWRDPLTATHPLYSDEQELAAVQHRYRQNVEDGQVDAEKYGQYQPTSETSLLCDLAGDLSDAYRAGKDFMHYAELLRQLDSGDLTA